jgi:GAF domain-containing protein
MISATINPETRIGTLSNYSVNPQVIEKQFDEFTALIANLCGIPKAVITLIDGHKVWFKSRLGVPNNFVYYKKSYCQFTVENKNLVEFSDVDNDPRLINHEWTKEYPQIKFYAGVPLMTAENEIIGTLCIMDSKAHVLTNRQKEMLMDLGKMVASLMESRRNKAGFKNEEKKPMDHPMISFRSVRAVTRSW